MKKSLGYFSISHKTATVSQREVYQISEAEKLDLNEKICEQFPDITGLLILVTCNRTEMYFESSDTSAVTLRDFFIAYKVKDGTPTNKGLFDFSDSSKITARHLLQVVSGLESSVMGDAEVIHQIKKAHLFSLSQHMQGSLLERAMQIVFKCHKRINNETHFRDGTTSLAYKTLKLVSKHFKSYPKNAKKILIVGAGDIVMQLFKYNAKFNFNNIHISNRTEERAKSIAKQQQCELFNWSSVVSNNLEDFDVIISAVGHRQHLITDIEAKHKKLLLIDLAVPTNIEKSLGENKNITLCDLDCISQELESNLESRLNSIDSVNAIITEELSGYAEWLQEATFRASLANYKQIITPKLNVYFENNSFEYSEELFKIVTNRILKEIIKLNNPSITSDEIDVIISEQFFDLSEALV